MPEPTPYPQLVITWEDVLTPGERIAAPSTELDPFGRDSYPTPAPDLSFSLELAEFLASQSLLIYGASESRTKVWDRLGLRETLDTDGAHTHCSIVEAADGGGAALVVFRGTTHLKHWLPNLQSIPTEWSGGGHVHSGFADAHQEVWHRIRPRLREIADGGRALILTGHSLGAALATLSLSSLIAEGAGPACAYTFGSPRVGNTQFAISLETARLFRFVNHDDLVTRYPLPFKPSRRLSFHHAGAAYYLDGSRVLHPRGPGDLEEESSSVSQLASLATDALPAASESRPPGPLADHAPLAYWYGLHTTPELGAT